MNVFMDGLMAAPLWVQIWVVWLMIVNSASFLFLKHRDGKVIAGVWILNGMSMMIAAEVLGYTRLLGAVHIVWWTPLMVYFFDGDRISTQRLGLGGGCMCSCSRTRFRS